MKYLEIYNNNILCNRIEVDAYSLGDIGLNFFTNGFDIDFDLMYKGIKEPFDEFNEKVEYDLATCRGEEYFKIKKCFQKHFFYLIIKLIDEEEMIEFICNKSILGMIEGDQLFFAPNIEYTDGKTKVRYYITFLEPVKVKFNM